MATPMANWFFLFSQLIVLVLTASAHPRSSCSCSAAGGGGRLCSAGTGASEAAVVELLSSAAAAWGVELVSAAAVVEPTYRGPRREANMTLGLTGAERKLMFTDVD